MSDFIDTAFPFIFGTIFLFMAYKFIKNKGFRGMMFGSEILTTIGEVNGESQSIMNTMVKVHVLKDTTRPGNKVGVEFIAKSVASYQMTPLTLSSADAKNLPFC